MTDKNEFAIRCAVVADLKFPTHFAITNDWRFGPFDLECAYDFDPSGFFVGELDGKVISHVNMTKYTGHSSFIGSFMVLEEYRGKGYGKATWDAAWKCLDHSFTVGLEALVHMVPKYESVGFRTVWETSVGFLDFKKIIKNFTADVPSGVEVLPITTVDKEKVYQYDSSVFGTSRPVMIEKMMNIPGGLGWAAVDNKGNVIGYNVVRPTIVGKGTEFALTIGPFFADNDQIARALLKRAAEECLANKAIPVTNFEIYYPQGGESGQQSARLIAQVEGTSTLFCVRMYTKGIPEGRQLDKVYGITHLAFD